MEQQDCSVVLLCRKSPIAVFVQMVPTAFLIFYSFVAVSLTLLCRLKLHLHIAILLRFYDDVITEMKIVTFSNMKSALLLHKIFNKTVYLYFT